MKLVYTIAVVREAKFHKPGLSHDASRITSPPMEQINVAINCTCTCKHASTFDIFIFAYLDCALASLQLTFGLYGSQ